MLLTDFFYNELQTWKLAQENYKSLEQAKIKHFCEDGIEFVLQFNPNRITSASANISKKHIINRPCFLCEKNRPQEQTKVLFGNHFAFLVNPFPILPTHFTIASLCHYPQSIRDYYREIYEILVKYSSLTIFYNGPKCGASAPDHLHLQASTNKMLPIQLFWNRLKSKRKIFLKTKDDADLSVISNFIVPVFAIIGKNAESINSLFMRLYNVMQEELLTIEEPMMNIVCWKESEEVISVIFPRAKHRSETYGTDFPNQNLISPGSLDMAGFIVASREEDFNKLHGEELVNILRECALPLEQLEHISQIMNENS